MVSAFEFVVRDDGCPLDLQFVSSGFAGLLFGAGQVGATALQTEEVWLIVPVGDCIEEDVVEEKVEEEEVGD